MSYSDSSLFKNDIFLSYARVDNLKLHGESKGWVEIFWENLEIRLAQLIGRYSIKIWKDESRLGGNQPVDDVIRKAVRDSAVFIALNSIGYNHPDCYCKKELEWFCEYAGKNPPGLLVKDHYRIMNVLIRNVKRDKWPDILKDATGFDFFTSKDPDDEGIPLETGTPDYNNALEDLAHSIKDTLDGIKDIPKKEETGDKQKGDKPSFSLFLADVQDKLFSLRERIFNDLSEKYTIIKDIPPPNPALEHEEKVREVLKQAGLSVHLFNQEKGKEIPGQAPCCYPEKQYKLACEENISRFIWMPPDVDPDQAEDTSYGQFLKQLTSIEESGTQDLITRVEPTLITWEIEKKINSLQKQKSGTGEDIPRVLLGTHRKDELHAYKVGLYLEKKRIEAMICRTLGSPGDNMDEYEDKLQQASLVILFFGLVDKDWVTSRARTTQKFCAEELIRQGNTRIKAIGIYLAPPEKTCSESELFHPGVFQFTKLNPEYKDEFYPEFLAPLFQQAGMEGVL